jgi:predicted MFS family arabinose efflux permease
VQYLNALPLLLSAFACASGLIATEMSVLGVLAHATPDRYNLGVGAGIGLCAFGALAASLSLNFLAKHLGTRQIACCAVTMGYLAACVLWFFRNVLPLWAICYVAAVLYAALYVFLNYCVSVSVYCFNNTNIRDILAKQMAVPFFAAQAIIPIASGWLFDAFGVSAMALLIGFCYTFPLIFILKMHHPNGRSLVEKKSKTFVLQGMSRVLLFIAAVSTFTLNWYFSSVLTFLSDQHISTLLIGGILSALNVAGIIGAGWVSTTNMDTPQQMKLLFVTALVCCPVIILVHALLIPGVSTNTVGLLLFAGFFTGVAGGLTNTLKFSLLDKESYTGYHRLLSLSSMSATLAGSIIGSLVVQEMGWSASLLFCIALGAFLSITPSCAVFSQPNKR